MNSYAVTHLLSRIRWISSIGVLTVVLFVVTLMGCGAASPANEGAAVDESQLEQAAEQPEPQTLAVYAYGDSGASGQFYGLKAARLGLSEGQLLWNETSSPEFIVVKDGVLYLVSSEPALSAVAIESGELLWTRPFDSPLLAPPVLGEKELWVTTMDGLVFRIATEDGAVMEQTRLGSAAYRSPLLIGQELLVATESGLVEQLPLTNGGLRGRVRSAAAPKSFLADDSLVVTVSSEGELQAFLRDGLSPLDMVVRYGPDLPNSAVLRDGLLYVGGTGFAVYDLHAGEVGREAEELGRVEELGAVHQILLSDFGPVVLDLYGYLHLLDAETLSPRFSHELSGEPTAAAVVESVVYVGTDTGRLYAVELPSGTVLWEAAGGNSAVRALFPRNEGLVVAYAAEGVLRYAAAELEIGAEFVEPAFLPERVELGSYTAIINEDGIQTEFAPDRTGSYEIQAAGRDGEELIIILLDEQGREMARNVGYRVDPRVTAELNAGSVYGIRLEPVMRGLGTVEVQLHITRR
ncbi:MAG: hypothetical protein EA428_07880 [Spirochaetaceae bacterium]|nr:MAG: hypothetical protein EA428_07880 [Spirochaetaceae bacterium]